MSKDVLLKNPRKISKGNKNILYLYSLPRVKPNIPPPCQREPDQEDKFIAQSHFPESSSRNFHTVGLQREMRKLGNNKCSCGLHSKC